MAQAQIDELKSLSVDKLKIRIKNYTYNVEKFKKLYKDRISMREEMQKNVNEVKKYKLLLRDKLASEGKIRAQTAKRTWQSQTKKETGGMITNANANAKKISSKSPPTTADTTAVDEKNKKKADRSQRALVKRLTKDVPSGNIPCNEANVLFDEKKVNPKNKGLGYFLLTKTNIRVYSPTYPTVKEFGYIRSFEPATKKQLKSGHHMTLTDYLQTYGSDDMTHEKLILPENCQQVVTTTTPTPVTVIVPEPNHSGAGVVPGVVAAATPTPKIMEDERDILQQCIEAYGLDCTIFDDM